MVFNQGNCLVFALAVDRTQAADVLADVRVITEIGHGANTCDVDVQRVLHPDDSAARAGQQDVGILTAQVAGFVAAHAADAHVLAFKPHRPPQSNRPKSG